MRYAVIENGVVSNVIQLHRRNAMDFPAAVNADDHAIEVGDVYSEGEFYRDGVQVPLRRGTLDAEITDLRARLNVAEQALNVLGVETRE